MKITITELTPVLEKRLEEAIANRYQYKETVFDPTTPEFVPDPNDPEAEIMVPLENRQKPNPVSKWEFVEEVLTEFVIGNVGAFEAERDVQANDIGKAAKEKVESDFRT